MSSDRYRSSCAGRDQALSDPQMHFGCRLAEIRKGKIDAAVQISERLDRGSRPSDCREALSLDGAIGCRLAEIRKCKSDAL